MHAASLRSRLQQAYKHAEVSIGRSALRHKKNYDRKANSHGLQTGQFVWLHDPSKKRGVSPKLQLSSRNTLRVTLKERMKRKKPHHNSQLLNRQEMPQVRNYDNHRKGSYSLNIVATQHDPDKRASCPIIVKFISYRKRSKVLSQRRKLAGSRKSIHEDLTRENTKLLKANRDHPKVTAAWTRDGRVVALVPAMNGREMKRAISSEADLSLL